MASDTPDSNDLVVRKSALSVDHASSRLLRRGLAALDEVRTICLKVWRLVVYESSVFILSDHWDREFCSHHTRGENDLLDSTWKNRAVILYEFHQTGRYIGKLGLPLINLADEGYSLIRTRSAGNVTVRSDFIHFHEDLQTAEFSRTVRIDYLFSRSGERQAVWTNEPFVDRYRLESEPFVPCETALRPEWATDTTLIALQPYADNPAPYNESSVKHVVIFREAKEFADAVANFDIQYHWHSGKLYSEFSPGSEIHRIAEFPIESRFIAHKTFQHGWLASASDNSGTWFLGPGRDEATSIIWKMKIESSEPRVSIFAIPNPYELTRQGILEIVDSNGDTWMPPDGHDRVEAPAGQADEEVLLDYDDIFVWGNNLILSVDIYGISLLYGERLLLL